MATIQSLINQAIGTTGSIVRGVKGLSKLKEISKNIQNIPSDREIAQVEAEQEARDVAARRQGFSDAQAQHETQEAARAAAEKLKEKDPNFGFYTTRSNQTAFGEPSPSDRFNLGVPEGYQKDRQYSAEQRSEVISRQRQTMELLQQQRNNNGGL